MRSFSGSMDSSKWNWPSSHWNTLNTISRTWLCTPDHSSCGVSAPISTSTRPWRRPCASPLIEASFWAGVILPARSRTSPRRSVGRLLVANTTRPPFM